MHKFIKTLKFKITFAYSLTFILIFTVLSLILFKITSDKLVNSDNQNILAAADIIASKVELSPLIIPLPEKENKIKIDYYNGKNFKNIFTSNDFPTPFKIDELPYITNHLGYKIAVKDYDLDGYQIIRVYISQSNVNLKNNINSLIYIFVIGNILSILIAFFVCYFLSYNLLKPINQIIQKADKINLSDKLSFLDNPNSNDELQTLSETINKMLKRINDSVKTQSNFFASASHELKTPLTIMKTEIEIKINEQKDLNKDFLYSQLEEVNRLKRLVDDFLIVSQISNKTLILRSDNFEIDSLILDIVEKMNTLLSKGKKFLKIDFDNSIEDFLIYADKDKITNILINLIENSIKYSSTNQINLSLKYINDSYVIEIKNNINKKIVEIDNLKKEFYQDDILKDGHGLGLWISEKIIKLHNGELNLFQDKNYFIAQVILKKH